MEWFAADNIEELRDQYKKLLIMYHPDNNPDMDTTKFMQEINAEYDKILKQFASNQSDSEFSAEKEFELKKVLKEVIRIKADILIELIGSWIWISGNTYSVKDKLKGLGFKWASKKHMWYWGVSGHRCSVPLPIEEIRAKYGSTAYRAQGEEPVGIR